MDDFLTKPIETDKLKTVLNKYLNPENGKNQPDQPDENGKEHFDREEVLSMLAGDEAILELILENFIKDTAERIKDLENFLNKKSFEEAGKTAHTMKGSAANLRCCIFSDLTKKAEHCIRLKNSQEAYRILEEIKKEWLILLSVLKKTA
ncbi:MAG: Hpt domain-containing protein [bacterium]